MTIQEIKIKLEKSLNQKRYRHSLNVMDTSVQLAKKHGEDVEKAAVAGLLHDCARDIRGQELFEVCSRFGIEINDMNKLQPELLHGQLGIYIAKEQYGITDDYILRAIRYHTTGCSNMSMLDKIVFIADSIEPNRIFPGVEDLRRTAYSDIDESVLQSLDRTIKYVISKGALIHPDTIEARNFLVLNKKKRNEALY